MQADDNFRGGGRQVLSSSNTILSILDSYQRGRNTSSAFTNALIQGLERGEADLHNDGKISIDELYSYIDDRVKAETPEQRPKVFIDKESDVMAE